jgi:hypothetical protein
MSTRFNLLNATFGDSYNEVSIKMPNVMTGAKVAMTVHRWDDNSVVETFSLANGKMELDIADPSIFKLKEQIIKIRPGNYTVKIKTTIGTQVRTRLHSSWIIT